MDGLSRLDVARVQTFLGARFPSVDRVARLMGGAWSVAFAFQTDGRDLVVRFSRFGDDYEKDRVAGSWHQPGLRVPEVLDVGVAFDGAYAVSERIWGAPLEGLDPSGWTQVLPDLLATLDSIRAIDLPGTGFGRWRPDGNAPHSSWGDWLLAIAEGPDDSRIPEWRSAIESMPGASSTFDRSFEALTDLVPTCPDVRRVVHGDLTAGNVLVNGSHITGVFDWGNSIVGDPLYDLAWLMFWAPWHPGLNSIDLHALANRHFSNVYSDDRAFEDRVRCYLIHVGLDAQQYSASMGRADDLARVGAQTLDIAGITMG